MKRNNKKRHNKHSENGMIAQPGAQAIVSGWRDTEYPMDPQGSWTGNTEETLRGAPPQIPQQDADEL